MSTFATSIRNAIVALSFTTAVGLIGCGTAPDPGQADEESRTGALNNGNGAAAGFTCDDGANTCTCVGDDDCNDMFGSGLCGGQASCDTSNPSRPVCTCTQALHTTKGKLGVTKINVGTIRAIAR